MINNVDKKRLREQINSKLRNTTSLLCNSSLEPEGARLYERYKNLSVQIVRQCAKNTNTILVYGTKGTVIEPHYHLSSEIVYIIAGVVRNIITGQLYQEGETFKIEPQQLHGMEIIQDCCFVAKWR